MRIRQSELRRLWQRKKEAYKLRLKTEGTAVKAAAPKAAAVAVEAKPKAAPRKKKTEEKTEE
jgi:hypothetical protein